jgi:hypothetical protein
MLFSLHLSPKARRRFSCLASKRTKAALKGGFRGDGCGSGATAHFTTLKIAATVSSSLKVEIVQVFVPVGVDGLGEIVVQAEDHPPKV